MGKSQTLKVPDFRQRRSASNFYLGANQSIQEDSSSANGLHKTIMRPAALIWSHASAVYALSSVIYVDDFALPRVITIFGPSEIWNPSTWNREILNNWLVTLIEFIWCDKFHQNPCAGATRAIIKYRPTSPTCIPWKRCLPFFLLALARSHTALDQVSCIMILSTLSYVMKYINWGSQRWPN